MILSLNSIINKSLKERNTINPTVYDPHNEIISLIHNEFQKVYMSKLYPNPKWTYRAFWVVATNIDENNEHIKFYNIIYELIKYLQHHKLPIPSVDWSKWFSISDEWQQIPILLGYTELSQRDTIKLIRDAIRELQINGLTKITDIADYATTHGISSERFNMVIKNLRTEGSIFEPVEGFYKCI